MLNNGLWLEMRVKGLESARTRTKWSEVCNITWRKLHEWQDALGGAWVRWCRIRTG